MFTGIYSTKKGRLAVEEQYLLQEFSLNKPLINLLPTTMRQGRCTTALVDYLVITHNDFIEKCRDIASKRMKSASAAWRQYKVPTTHIHECHLLEYEQKIQSIILSHCHYSLTSQEIEYDLSALEEDILNQFFYGKPTIQLVDIPNVAYCKDSYTMETFLEIRHKVKPQVNPWCMP